MITLIHTFNVKYLFEFVFSIFNDFAILINSEYRIFLFIRIWIFVFDRRWIIVRIVVHYFLRLINVFYNIFSHFVDLFLFGRWRKLFMFFAFIKYGWCLLDSFISRTWYIITINILFLYFLGHLILLPPRLWLVFFLLYIL
jgi:hypothetical protein